MEYGFVFSIRRVGQGLAVCDQVTGNSDEFQTINALDELR